MELNSILKMLRQEKGLTQAELANELGIARSTLSSYENGARFPEKEIIETIADYFNVDIDYLYGKASVRKKVHFDEEGKAHYYLDVETADIAQKMLDNRDLRMLMYASAKASPEDLQMLIKIVNGLNNTKG